MLFSAYIYYLVSSEWVLFEHFRPRQWDSSHSHKNDELSSLIGWVLSLCSRVCLCAPRAYSAWKWFTSSLTMRYSTSPKLLSNQWRITYAADFDSLLLIQFFDNRHLDFSIWKIMSAQNSTGWIKCVCVRICARVWLVITDQAPILWVCLQ